MKERAVPARVEALPQLSQVRAQHGAPSRAHATVRASYFRTLFRGAIVCTLAAG